MRLAFVSWMIWAAVASAGDGFRDFYNLEYDAAVGAFRREIASAPREPDGYNHLAQAILYRASHRAGLLEASIVAGDDFLLSLLRQPRLEMEAEEDGEFQSAVRSAMDTAQQKLRLNSDDARALYALGVAYGLRANYDFLVRKAWLAAIRDSTTARKLHNRLSVLDPQNADARLMQGVQDYVVASLPGALRFLGAVAGIRGDKERGLRTLEEVAARGKVNHVDASILLATLYRHEKRHSQAAPILARLRRDYPHNYLFHIGEVYTLAELRDESAASTSLRELERLHAAGARGYAQIQTGKVTYTGGVVLCRFGHLERAVETMRRVLDEARGADRQTRLLATERLGMLHDLRGERELARRAYREVVQRAPGTAMARESQKYLEHRFQGCGSD